MSLKASISPRRYSGSFLLKMLITTALLVLLAGKIDLKEVNAIIAGLNRAALMVAMLLTLGAVILSAYKWGLLLTARGWALSLATLTRLYFVGLFMNNFLPSSIGGDVMRIYQVGQKIGNRDEAAASVILERVLATVGLAIPAIIALIPNYRLAADFALPVAGFFVLCCGLSFLLARPAVFLPLTTLSWRWWQRLVNKLADISGIIRSFGSRRLVLLQVTAYSVLFQFIVVLINYSLLKAMGVGNIGFWHCALLVPVISAVSMIPVSINGLGIREAAYVLLFGPAGLSAGEAVTLSMLFFLVVTMISLLGGLIFLTEGERKEFGVARYQGGSPEGTEDGFAG